MAGRWVIRAPIGQGHVCYRPCHTHQHFPLTLHHHQLRPTYMFERDLGLVKHPRTRGNGKRLPGTLCLAFSSPVRSSRSHQQYWTRPRGAVFHSILLHHSNTLIFGQSFFGRTRWLVRLVSRMRVAVWEAKSASSFTIVKLTQATCCSR